MLLRVASVAVPAFAVFVCHAVCQAVYLDERRAGRRVAAPTAVGVILQASRTRRGRWPALGVLVSALAALTAAWGWWRHA